MAHSYAVLPGSELRGDSRLALSSLVVFLVRGATDSSASSQLQLLPRRLAPRAVASGPVEMGHDDSLTLPS